MEDHKNLEDWMNQIRVLNKVPSGVPGYRLRAKECVSPWVGACVMLEVMFGYLGRQPQVNEHSIAGVWARENLGRGQVKECGDLECSAPLQSLRHSCSSTTLALKKTWRERTGGIGQ